MSAKQQRKEPEAWKKESANRDRCRRESGIKEHLTLDEEAAFDTINAKADYGFPDAPVMPVVSAETSTSAGNCRREHQDDIAPAGYVSSEWFAVVHTPVPIPQALKIPKARQNGANW